MIQKSTARLSGKSDIWHFRYNAFDQITDVYDPRGEWWRYTYDALGRRASKEYHRGAEYPIERMIFTWDEAHLIEQHDARATRWTYLPSSHIPITQTIDSNVEDSRTELIVSNAVGAPNSMVSVTGHITGIADVSLWGETEWTGESQTNLRYLGQQYDHESGLHYNIYRTYDPHTGRFLTSDPLGISPSANPVAYPHNPTVWADPLGLTPCRDNRTFDNRREAFNAALDRAGVPRSQQPVHQWEVGNDPAQRHRVGNYVFDENPGSHGRYYQYETPMGTRVIVEHTNDPNAPQPHFHAGKPKQDGHDIPMMGERYQQIGDKHHYYYPGQ